MLELLKLTKGKSASLSPKQIICGRINLIDARKFLSPQDYALVSMVFDEISSHDEKRLLHGFNEYAQMAMKIIAHFDILVPYHLISGDAKFRNTVDSAEEQEKDTYRANARAYLVARTYRYSGDAAWDKMIEEFYSAFLAI